MPDRTSGGSARSRGIFSRSGENLATNNQFNTNMPPRPPSHSRPDFVRPDLEPDPPSSIPEQQLPPPLPPRATISPFHHHQIVRTPTRIAHPTFTILRGATHPNLITTTTALLRHTNMPMHRHIPNRRRILIILHLQIHFQRTLPPALHRLTHNTKIVPPILKLLNRGDNPNNNPNLDPNLNVNLSRPP